MGSAFFLPEPKTAADQYDHQDNSGVGNIAQAHGQTGRRYEQQRERTFELRQEKKGPARDGNRLSTYWGHTVSGGLRPPVEKALYPCRKGVAGHPRCQGSRKYPARRAKEKADPWMSKITIPYRFKNHQAGCVIYTTNKQNYITLTCQYPSPLPL